MFDPAYPPTNAEIESAPLRSQFNGLKALIDAITTLTAAEVDSTSTLPPSSPANAQVSVMGNTLHFSFEIPQGQEGPMGQQGPPFGGAEVDAVNTLPPGQPAAVGVSFDGTNVHFTFDIPRGDEGSQGPAGNDGSDGAPGPPFAQAVVDAVDTLPPGQPAAVGVSFDGTNVHFTFSIPRGNNGNDGAQGPPGEVSLSQLETAISGTSANTNNVTTLGQAADSSYNQGQMQELLDKLDELINTLRRAA